ncbi:hypothetical protein Tco_1575226 [Tanacetum coccineum]
MQGLQVLGGSVPLTDTFLTRDETGGVEIEELWAESERRFAKALMPRRGGEEPLHHQVPSSTRMISPVVLHMLIREEVRHRSITGDVIRGVKNVLLNSDGMPIEFTQVSAVLRLLTAQAVCHSRI